MNYYPDEDSSRYDDYLDELHEHRHRRIIQAKLRHMEPGHPDEEELLDALEGLDKQEAEAQSEAEQETYKP